MRVHEEAWCARVGEEVLGGEGEVLRATTALNGI